MGPASQADPDLDTLIWEITADCNDEEEVLMGSRATSMELPMPRHGRW